MGTPKGTKPWNAGTGNGWTDKRGYRWKYITRNGKRVARREHRLVMEAHLGRELQPWELVHHRDGDTENNALENLELMEFGAHTATHHSGSRRDQDARRSMEAFGLMRETLKKERAIGAELLAALGKMLARWDALSVEDLGPGCRAIADTARAAIAKAKGGAQ